MTSDDFQRFADMLAKAMRQYGKPLPEAAEIEEWFGDLTPWPVSIVGASFAQCIQRQPRFSPTPASVIACCRELDGRPTGDEAWATALVSMDQEETIRWTTETAIALSACRPILSAGDRIGARRAFLDSYEKLILAARIRNFPAIWEISAGFDKDRRARVIADAHALKLPIQKSATMLLPAPMKEVDEKGVPITETSDESSIAQIAKIKLLLVEMKVQKRAAEKQAELDRIDALESQRQEIKNQKIILDAKVTQITQGKAA